MRTLARCCCLPMWQRNTLATTPVLPQTVWGLPMPACCCFVSKHIELQTDPRIRWHTNKHKMSQTEKYAQVYLMRQSVWQSCNSGGLLPLNDTCALTRFLPHAHDLTAFLPCTAFSQPSDSPPFHIFFILWPIKALLALITPSFNRSPFHPHLFFVHIPPRAWCSADHVTQDVVSSLYTQFTLNVPNEQFPTLPFPATLPLPL